VGRCVLIECEVPEMAPLFHFVGRAAEAAGHEVVPSAVVDGATIAVGFGMSCRLADRLGGVWMSPDLTDPGTVAVLSRAAGPGLVIGASGDPGWDPAAAARLRQFEVLQLAHVDRHFEVAGDPIATLGVYARILDRVGALMRRTPV
jgi:hypothetical protein